MNPWKVYIITNSTSGKNYIGITSKPIERRLKEHIDLANSKSRRHSNGTLYALHAALIKHGPGNFEIKTLESNLTLDAAIHKESYYIKKFNSYGGGRSRPDYPRGYNETPGGEMPDHDELEYASRLSFTQAPNINNQLNQQAHQAKNSNKENPEEIDPIVKMVLIVLFVIFMIFI